MCELLNELVATRYCILPIAIVGTTTVVALYGISVALPIDSARDPTMLNKPCDRPGTGPEDVFGITDLNVLATQHVQSDLVASVALLNGSVHVLCIAVKPGLVVHDAHQVSLTVQHVVIKLNALAPQNTANHGLVAPRLTADEFYDLSLELRRIAVVSRYERNVLDGRSVFGFCHSDIDVPRLGYLISSR